MHGATNLGVPEAPRKSHIRYSTVKGFFLQSEEDTDSKQFDFLKQNFGLIDRSYETDGELDLGGEQTQWRKFQRYVRHKNSNSDSQTQFKVLFMGRHGQGWHNVAETKYGTHDWDCYWSKLDGADGITWSDANLTETGQEQAKDVHDFWESHLPLEGGGIPAPDSYYVSPLVRAIETSEITFERLKWPDGQPYQPVVKELLREAIGVHTCDRRSPASRIRERFPSLTFEPDFAEEDPLYSSDLRESRSARKVRMMKLLDDIFTHDDGAFISFTSHSGAIASILEAIEHRQFDLQTGGVITAFVKAERVDGERELPRPEPSETASSCMVNPTARPN